MPDFGKLIWVLPSFWCKQDFCYSFLMNTASLFADPNLLQLESEAMINTDDAPSQRSADATAPFAPKARENPNQNAKITVAPIG